MPGDDAALTQYLLVDRPNPEGMERFRYVAYHVAPEAGFQAKAQEYGRTVFGRRRAAFSLANGASPATAGSVPDTLTRNAGASNEITLREEEISDVSLAKFYVIEKEKAGTFRPGLRLAQGAGCGGCGCWTGSYYTSSDAYPPPSRPVPPTRRHVQKKP